MSLLDETVHVFRPGQLLLEGTEAEARVDALLEDSAQVPISFEDNDSFRPFTPSSDSCGDSCRASSDNQHVNSLTHSYTAPFSRNSFVLPTRSLDSPPCLVI